MLKWFDAHEATEIGTTLADQFAGRTAAGLRKDDEAIQEILERADSELRNLQLNLYKKAKFANGFKWRLLELGVERALAEELTQRLVMHVSGNTTERPLRVQSRETPAEPLRTNSTKSLFAQGNSCIDRGAYAEAINFYVELIRIDPAHAAAHNNFGAALSKLGRYVEAESEFRLAIKLAPKAADAYGNLGNTFFMQGQYASAENFLRRALKLNPRLVSARVNLGLTLAFSNRLGDARAHFAKALKTTPRNAEALFGMALVEKTEGRFDQADENLSRALSVDPKMSTALASQVAMRKMTSKDKEWISRAEQLAATPIGPVDEAELRFAIGKYYDDIENFKLAFENYKRANDLLKPSAEPYDREVRSRFVEMTKNIYTRQSIASANADSSASMKPVFVVGMPRSGTSLMEQIIASHPSARGAGELDFWSNSARSEDAAITNGLPDRFIRHKLAETYLRTLEARTGDALRIVDKSPVNSDYLGVIHSVFPRARIIYMTRDPIDTCLSCYFQRFVLSLNYTLDLSDLADYYQQHQTLMQHWRAVLPPETILDVPYEGLVADQARWSRKVLDFLELEWDEKVLNFHETPRSVVTASFWQVRQKIYAGSVHRWRNYKKFIGPLLPLRGLGE